MSLRLAYAALIALACFGLTYNLGDRMLWADEAETALLAVNITKFGLPIADDGKNDLQRTRPGSRSEHNLWIWSPWLDEYVAASSFALLGESTFSAVCRTVSRSSRSSELTPAGQTSRTSA